MAPRTRKSAPSPSPAPERNGDVPPAVPPKDETTTVVDVDALLAPVVGEEREEVKVNNASATDMKHACDDALKRVCTLPFYHSCAFRPLPQKRAVTEGVILL